MRGKYWPTPQARGADGLVRGTLRGNGGPSSLKGSLVAMAMDIFGNSWGPYSWKFFIKSPKIPTPPPSPNII